MTELSIALVFMYFFLSHQLKKQHDNRVNILEEARQRQVFKEYAARSNEEHEKNMLVKLHNLGK